MFSLSQSCFSPLVWAALPTWLQPPCSSAFLSAASAYPAHRTQWFLLQQNMNIKAKMHLTLSVNSLQISQLSVSAFSIDLNQNITCRVCWRILICPFFSSSSADMSALTDSTWGVQIANKHLHPKFKSLLSYIRWEMHCYLISVGIGLAGPLLTLILYNERNISS